jgi:CheY-like chemotaxis protein
MLSILLIEDDEADVFMLRKAFTREGLQWPIQAVNDGGEGVRYLKGEGDYSQREKFPFPNLILLDLNMPVMSGFDVLEWLKGHDAYSVVPKMIVSASNRSEDIDKAYRLGANAYFVKPSSLTGLQAFARATHEFWTTCSKPLVR